MANVKVAVRVRPLSKREHAEGGAIIVETEDRVAKVKKVKVDSRFESVWGTREKVVSFGFDYCYWSVDPEDPRYASQEMVFQDLGTMVLSSAFKGYNICLFAYGQTGSGKTYTMMGTPASIGLTPRICQGLFSREGASSKQSTSCRVEVSFLEIYNEQVRDLLKQSNHKKPYTLRVREHPEMGPYVQGLSQHVVTDYRQVVGLLEEGIANRITAATHVHDASSRSHAIFTIQYTQAILENNLPSETASKINLVDLAGSEKADPSYCKHRITEGANINKSLVTLGIVISTLAENTQMFSSCQSISSIASEVDSDRTDSYCGSSSNSCKRQAYIPYRDSILTWLLKDSLGGNSKTIMIATISPASCCYNETVNTLRYASNAKKIINKPRVNEDANVKLIRELQEEIRRLKVMLMNFEMMNSSPSWSDDKEGNLTELVLQNEIKIDQLTKDWTDKWINRKAIMEEYSVDINKKKAGVTIDSNLPHFVAMDNDILSTGVVLYHLREGTTKIGRSDSNQDQDIVLQGQGIERDHCIVDNRHGIVTLRPLQGAHCVVNEHEVTDSIRLSQGAVVVLGKTHKFRFNHPAEAALLRQRRSICETSSVVNFRSLEWLDLDGDFSSLSYSFYSAEAESNEQRDLAYEECQPKLKNHEILQSREIQHQQQYIEELQQQILDGQIKDEQELERDQAVIDRQIRENQQWLIDEKKRLASQEQRESAVQTEVKSYAEAGVQHESELDIRPSLTEQNKKKLVQLELLRKYSLKKAERHLSQKKLKLHLERIVKKQKLLEAKKNLEWLETTCWVSKNSAISLQFLNQDTSIKSSSCKHSWPGSNPNPESLQCQRKTCLQPQSPQFSIFLKSDPSPLSTSAHNYTCSIINPPRKSPSAEYFPRAVQEHSRRNTHEEDGSFLAQKQIIKKQDIYFRNKGIVENNYNNTEVIYLSKHKQTMDRSDSSLRPTRSKAQISKACSENFKEKHEPETKKEGSEIKQLGELIQHLEKNAAQEANRKFQVDKRKKHQSSFPGNSVKKLKKSSIYGKPYLQQWTQTPKNFKKVSLDKHPLEKHEFLRVAPSARSLNNLNSYVSLCYGKRRWHSAEMLNDRISKTIPDPLISWQEGEDIEFSDTDSNYSVDSLSCATSEVLTGQLSHLEESAQIDTVELEGSESGDSQMSQDSLTEKENNAESQNMNDSPEVHQEPIKFCKDENRQSLLQLTSTSTSGDLTINARSFSLDSLGDADEVSDLADESKRDPYDEVPAEVFWKLQNLRSDSVVSDPQNKLEICSESSALSLNASSFYLGVSSQFSTVCDQTLNKMKISFSGQGGSADQVSHTDGENLPVLTDAWLSNNLKNQKNRPIITVPSSQDRSEFWVPQMYPANKSSYWMKRDDVRQSAAELSFITCYKKPHQISHEPNKIERLISSTAPSVPLPETRKQFEVEGPEDTSLFSFSSKNSSFGHVSTFPTKPCYSEHASLPTSNCQQLNSLSEARSTSEWEETSSCLKPTSESVSSPYSEVSRDQDFKNNLLTFVPNAPILQKEEIYINTDFEECLFRTIEKGDASSDSGSNTRDSKIVELNHIDKVALHSRDQFAILTQTSEPEKDSMQECRDVLRESALEVPSFREVEEVPRAEECDSENKFEFQTKGLMNGSSSSIKVDYSGTNVSQKAFSSFSAQNMMENSSEDNKCNINSVSKQKTPSSVDFVIDKSVHSNADGSEKKTNTSLDCSCEISEKFTPQFSSDICYENIPRIKEVCQMRSSFMENNSNPPDQKHPEIANHLVYNSIHFEKNTSCCTPAIKEQKDAPELNYSFNKNVCLGGGLHSGLSRNDSGNDSRRTLGEDGILSVTASQNFCLYTNKMSNNLKESVERRIPRMSEGDQTECNSTAINSEELNKLVISINELECDMLEMKLSQHKRLHNYCTLEALESKQNSEVSNLIQRPNNGNEKCCPNHSVVAAVEDEEKIQLTDSSEEDLYESELAMRCESNTHIPTTNHNEVQEKGKQLFFPEDIKESSKSTVEFSDAFDQLIKNDTCTENIHGSEPSETAVTMKYRQDTNLSYSKEDKNIYSEIFSKEGLTEYPEAIQEDKADEEINYSDGVDKEQREGRKNEECANSKLTELPLAENTSLLQENQTPCFIYCGNGDGTKYDTAEIPEIYFTASKLEEQNDELDLLDICINSIETHDEKGSANLWNHVREILKDNNASANLGDNKGVTEWCGIKKEFKQVSDVESINAPQSSPHYSQNSISEHCDKFVENSLDAYKSTPRRCLPKENEPVHLISPGQVCIPEALSQTIKAQTMHTFKAEKEGECFKENNGNPEQDIFQDQVLPANICSYCCSDNDASLNEVSKQKGLLPHMFSRNDADTVDNLMPVNQRTAPENINQDYGLTSITVERFSDDPTPCPLLQTEIKYGENRNSDPNTANDPTLPLSNNVCNEVLQYYDTQRKSNGKAGTLSSVDKEEMAKSVDDLMLNKTLNYSASEQSPNKQGTYSKFMECHKSLDYASGDNTQNNVFPHKRLDSSVSYSVGNFHEESEQLLNSFNIPQKESATLGLIVSEKIFSTSVFKDEIEEMTYSFQDCFENSVSQKEVDSLVQYNQENKCLTSKCIESECKTNIEKCNQFGGCQTETTESRARRTSHDFSIEDNTVATSEVGETLSRNSDKFIWENTPCMDNCGSGCNMNSYISGHSARHLNTLATDDLYFEESKFLNSEGSDLPVSSAEDYALCQQDSKNDGHGGHIEEIYQNKKQSQNDFPECICDQENASLRSDNYTTRTETKLPEKNLLTPPCFNERSSHETTTPKCSMRDFSACILSKNVSPPKSQECSTCSTCTSSTNSQHNSLLDSSLSATFQLQENNSICHQDLPDSCSSSSETSLKSNTSLSETLIPAALNPSPLNCPSITASQMQESQCEDSEILNPPLCASETIHFLAEGNQCLPLSSCQRNSILDCNGIHNLKSEKKCHEVTDCQEPRNIVLPQKECLKDSDKTLYHNLNTNLVLEREQSTLYLSSNVDAINISTTEIGNSHTTALKMVKAEREILTSDQLNSSRKHDRIPSRYLSINDCLTLQEEPAPAIHKNKNNISTSQNAKRMKKDREWSDLQSHSLSAPVIATSVVECASETSEVDFSVHLASKSLQELNMSIEPPSPTEDDMCSAKSLSKLKTENVAINYKPKFQKKSIEAQGDYKEQSQDIPSSDSPPVLCLKAVAYSTDNPTDIEASKYSSSITPLHGYINKNKELRYQLEAANELDKENNDSMHFNSSDINPYIHTWQQDECCKMGWKQYVFGSASDVSGNPPPLSLDNQTVMRCSSVDNGLNSQNSPFHSHLSSYANARMLSSTLSSTEDLHRWDVARESFESTHSDGNGKHDPNISQDELENTPENCISTCENVLPDMRCTQQSENTSTQVDEIVLFYPTKTNLAYNKQQEILIRDQETQTEAPAKHKRQKRHRRSYTDLPAKKPEPSKSSFQEPSSWSSVQNLSMHLSQLLHNTSELLGNLSFQTIKDNEPSYHKAVEQRTSFSMLDRHTQTTEDIGIQTDMLGYPRNTIEDRQIIANMQTDLMKSQEVNVIVKLVHPDIINLPKERTSKTKGRKLLSMPDIRSHDVDTQEHYYLPQSTLGIHSSSSSEVPKAPLTISSSPAFNSPKVYPTASPLYNSRLKSSATAVSNPASCISLSPNCYFQDKNPIDKTSISETREPYCKNNFLVDRASSPILILSASPINQQNTSEISTTSSKPSAGKEEKSTENSGTGFKKKDSDLQYNRCSWESCLDTCSHAEVDSESTPPRERKDVHKRSGNGLDKNTTKVLSKKQKQRFTIDTHTAVHTERLYHSSSTLELSSHGEYVMDDHGETLPAEHSFRQTQAMRRARNLSGEIKSGNSIRNSECSPSKKSLPKSLNEHNTSSCVKSEETHECVPDSSQPCPQIWRNEKTGCFHRSEMSDLQDDVEDDDDDDDDTKTGSDIDSVCNTEILLNGNTSLVKAHRHRSYSLRDLPMHNKFSNWCGVKGAPHSSLTSLTLSASDIHSQTEGKSVNKRTTEIEERSLLSERRAREIERLRRERAQVMSGIHLDMSQQPLTVELTEAKLTYGIGETDAQLRILQNVVGEELTAVPIKQQLYERHKKSIEILRKQREERLQCFRRSRSLSPQKHLSFLQTLDSNQREIDLPSRRREYLQQLRRDIVENTRVQEPKMRIQRPSEIEQLLREYQRAQEETKTEIARARDKLRERAEQEKKRIREQIYSQLQKEETKLKTLVSTSTLHTDSTLSLSSGPTSGYNSSNTATYSASILSKQGAQLCAEDVEHSAEDARGRSAIRNHQLCMLKQVQKGSASETFPVTSSSMEKSSHRYPHSLIISPSTFSASSVKGYEDLSKHVLANATAEVMAVCSNDLKNLYSGQATAGWKYQCTEKNVFVYYKAFSSSTTKHGFLGAGMINQPLSTVLCMLKDASKRHLYDKTITTAQVHKKITTNIELVYVVSDDSFCYQKQPRDFCCICVEAKEENMYILALQSVYEESMPRPCKEMVRGEILPSAWILQPDTRNGKDITKVIYMVQVDLGAPAIPVRLLSSFVKRQPLVIAQLSHFLTT